MVVVLSLAAGLPLKSIGTAAKCPDRPVPPWRSLLQTAQRRPVSKVFAS